MKGKTPHFTGLRSAQKLLRAQQGLVKSTAKVQDLHHVYELQTKCKCLMFYEAGNHTEFALQAFLTKDDITESKVSKQEPLGTIYLAFIASV